MSKIVAHSHVGPDGDEFEHAHEDGEEAHTHRMARITPAGKAAVRWSNLEAEAISRGAAALDRLEEVPGAEEEVVLPAGMTWTPNRVAAAAAVIGVLHPRWEEYQQDAAAPEGARENLPLHNPTNHDAGFDEECFRCWYARGWQNGWMDGQASVSETPGNIRTGAPAERFDRAASPEQVGAAIQDGIAAVAHEQGRKHSQPWCLTHDAPMVCSAGSAREEQRIRDVMLGVVHAIRQHVDNTGRPTVEALRDMAAALERAARTAEERT